MSFDSHMIHTCSILRKTETAEDRFGGPGTQSSVVIYSGVCRLVEKQQRVYSNEAASWIAVTVYKLFLPVNALVQDSDLISSITLEDGEELENAFVIKQFLNRRGNIKKFISVDLQRAS